MRISKILTIKIYFRTYRSYREFPLKSLPFSYRQDIEFYNWTILQLVNGGSDCIFESYVFIILRNPVQLICHTNARGLQTKRLGPAVQRADNFIQRISRYPADIMYWLEYILFAGY